MFKNTLNPYLDIYHIALRNYIDKKVRPGYTSGIFTKMRHDGKKYPHIEKLELKLQSTDNPLDVLEEYFKSPETKLNNHSFAMYLLDALEANFPRENWGRFYPPGKQVIFYQGLLYRGTMQPPASVFKTGMRCLKSESIDDYATPITSSVGVSTSKSIKIAQEYASTGTSGPKAEFAAVGMGATTSVGWVYLINYRGIGGVDIVETLNARKSRMGFFLTRAAELAEVNVIGDIKPEDIVGYIDGQTLHKNPNYQSKLTPGVCETFFHRRVHLFLDQKLIEEKGYEADTESTSRIDSPAL